MAVAADTTRSFGSARDVEQPGGRGAEDGGPGCLVVDGRFDLAHGVGLAMSKGWSPAQQDLAGSDPLHQIPLLA
jgi:hypothetical protein